MTGEAEEDLRKQFRLSKGSSQRRSRIASRRFSIVQDTATNFVSHDNLYFGGPYAHIRKSLDYNYHTNYTKERQWLQDSIIDKLLHEIVQNETAYEDSVRKRNKKNGSSMRGSARSVAKTISQTSLVDTLSCLPTQPWLVYVAGTAKANRSSVVRNLMEKNRFPILSFIIVDPMEIQGLLPEFDIYIKKYGTFKGEELMRKEVGYIAEILTRAALQIGTNVLVYSEFWYTDWYARYFQILREEFNELKIAILHTLANDEQIIVKQSSPFKNCFCFGRDSTTTAFHDCLLEDSNQRIFGVAYELIPQIEYYCLLRETLDGSDLEIKTKGVTWKSFCSNFEQVCAIVVEDMLQVDKITNQRGESNFIQKFDIFKSTEENYQSDKMVFYGPYAHLRKTLDYTYHKNYRKDRQLLQDAIILDTLDKPMLVDQCSGEVCTTPTEPFLIFTAGAMGAGKSHTLDFLSEREYFPLSAFVLIDPDAVRQTFPEFSLYVAQNKLTAGELTRKEAGYVVEILTLAALQSGKNVLVDTSLRDHEWYADYFQRIRKDYPQVKLGILHVEAPRDAVFQRAEARGKLTGRVVPTKTLEMALEQVPKSVDILKTKVDCYCALNNAPNTDIEISTRDVTWEKFTNMWVQTCAWIPKERKKPQFRTSRNSTMLTN